MIAWNAFFAYILKPTLNIKVIVGLMLLGAVILRRTGLHERLKGNLRRIPVGKALVVLFFLAFSLRLGWVLWSPHVPPAPITEDLEIWRHANDLAEGKGFRTAAGEYSARRPIGYPLFLSFLIRIFGPSYRAPELSQVALGVLSAFLIFGIGKKLVSERLGLAAAFLWAGYPTAVMSTKLLLDEHLFIPLWLMGVLLLIQDYQKPALSKVTLAGLAVGVSALFRTYSVVMAPAVFFVWFLSKRDVKGAFVRGALMTVLILVCALPWAIRNYFRLGAPLFYTSVTGMHLYLANNPTSDVRYPINPGLNQGGDPDYLHAKTEVERDYAGRKATFNWIRKNPSLFAMKALGRLCYMLGLNNEGWVLDDNFYTIKPGARQPSPKQKKNLGKLELYYYVGVFWWAVLGLFLLIARAIKGRPFGEWSYLVATLGLYLLVPTIALNHRKYRFVIEPFLCLLAAHGVFLAYFSQWPNRLRRI